MIIYTDSEILYLKKILNEKNIFLDSTFKIEDFNIDNINYLKDQFVLILISNYIYQNNIDEIFKSDNFFKSSLKRIIDFYSCKEKKVLIPLVPISYFYQDFNYWEKIDKNSNFRKVYEFNSFIIKEFSEKSNVIILDGLSFVSKDISKEFFRFNSIYNLENSRKLVNQIINLKKQITIPKKKLIILDLDNTLWKGIIDEDSFDGIRMSESDSLGSIFSWVQSKLLELKKNGFLIAICSKNYASVALKALFNHPDSKFKTKDIVSYKINWESKSSNIKRITEELNLSLTDAIFIDDNIHECNEVKVNCEGITVIQVPQDIYKYPDIFKKDVFYSDNNLGIDIDRTKLYKEREKRKIFINEQLKNQISKSNWLESLEINVEFISINSETENINRIVQLFNRTNQFNLNSKKYSLELFKKQISKDNIYYACLVNDKIGNDGLVSVIGCSSTEKYIFVNDFILSCRVFGRNIEEIMLLPILDKAIEMSLPIKFNSIGNERNKVVTQFILKLTNGTNIIENNCLIKTKNNFKQLPLSINNYDFLLI